MPSPDQEENSMRQCWAGSFWTSHKQVDESINKVVITLRNVEAGCYVICPMDPLDVSIYEVPNIGLLICLSVLFNSSLKVGFNGLNIQDTFHVYKYLGFKNYVFTWILPRFSTRSSTEGNMSLNFGKTKPMPGFRLSEAVTSDIRRTSSFILGSVYWKRSPDTMTHITLRIAILKAF